MEPDRVRVAETRHQKAAGALDRRLRLGKIGRVEHRPAIDLQHHVAKFDQLELLVVADFAGPQLPGRRGAGVVLAQIAGRVDAAPQFEAVAVGAPRGVGGKPRAVGEQHPHILRECVVHRIPQFHEIGEHDLAGRQQQADMAGSGDGVAALAVAHRIGEQDLAPLRDLDMPLGDGQRQPLVILDLVGLEDDRRVLVLFRTADVELRQCRQGAEQQHRRRAKKAEPRAPADRPPSSRSGETCHPAAFRLVENCRHPVAKVLRQLGRAEQPVIIHPRGEAASRCRKSCLHRSGSRRPAERVSWPKDRGQRRYRTRNRAENRQRRR